MLSNSSQQQSEDTTVIQRRMMIGILAIAMVAFIAGCSKSKTSTSTVETPSPTSILSPLQQWSLNVCNAVNNWDSQIATITSDLTTSIAGSLLAGQARTAVQDKISQGAQATQQMVSDLAAAGLPPLQQGAQVASELNGLSSRVSAATAQLKIDAAAVPTDNAQDFAKGISALAAQLSAVFADVQSTINRIETLDPKGELDQALASVPQCRTLIQRAGGTPAPSGSQTVAPGGSAAPNSPAPTLSVGG